jgi:hypothetical protein
MNNPNAWSAEKLASHLQIAGEITTPVLVIDPEGNQSVVVGISVDKRAIAGTTNVVIYIEPKQT